MAELKSILASNGLVKAFTIQNTYFSVLEEGFRSGLLATDMCKLVLAVSKHVTNMTLLNAGLVDDWSAKKVFCALIYEAANAFRSAQNGFGRHCMSYLNSNIRSMFDIVR